ncbi:MAG: hypothetical protein BJ554DRAFT_1710 [Olpidium bornovanus]|uniref:Uncharacterized protein n=1 Tax=Olpidium bornovanus TaxID=278681 RepID=A0A8H7ZS06_9FUNG|nr:MAG: hypothetical protein BJ554DRAFT_1710 [Olpidium bornovanus]
MDVTQLARARMDAKYANSDEACPPKVDWTGLGVVIGLDPSVEREQGGAVERAGAEADWPTEEAAAAAIELSHDEFGNWEEVMLAEGAIFACEIRKRVFDELHYTCSAGASATRTC